MSVFDLIKWSPTFTRLAYNWLYGRIASKQYSKNKAILEQLSKFKDIHIGKRCFIIGTGPSLTIEDLESLKGEITFAPNRIYELQEKTIWRPTFYMCQDHNIIQTFGDKIKGIESDVSFLPINYKNDFVGDKYRFFVLKEKNYYPKDAEFSKDVAKFIAQGYTVTYGAIQMAIYMGFKEIYLVGIDHNYNITRDASGRPVRNADSENYSKGMSDYVNMNNLPRIEESTIAYEVAEKVSRKMGVRIYNATRGGMLEAFERINLDNVLNKKVQ